MQSAKCPENKGIDPQALLTENDEFHTLPEAEADALLEKFDALWEERASETPARIQYARRHGKLVAPTSRLGESTDGSKKLEEALLASAVADGRSVEGVKKGFVKKLGKPPGEVRLLVSAIKRLFGTEVKFVAVSNPDFNFFNGAYFGGNTLYVNVASPTPPENSSEQNPSSV